MLQVELTPKRRAALALLQKAGIAPNSYAPLAVLMLWRFGFDCPPPHMARFASVVLAMGGCFAVVLAAAMWLFAQSHSSTLQGLLWLWIAIGAGVAFGFGMAIRYAVARAKHKIPLWKDFTPAPDA